MPDFTFTLSGAFTPTGTLVENGDVFDHAPWENLFGNGDFQKSLRFQSSGAGLTISTLTVNFNSPVSPLSGWAFAVTDLEGEDAVLSASLSGSPVANTTIAGWYQGLFDSQPATPGSPHLPSGFDAANAAVVAEFDPDGILSNEILSPVGTESASAWFMPDVPIDQLTVSHHNRFGGPASMHLYMAAVPEPGTVALFAAGGAMLLAGRRRKRLPAGNSN